MILTPEKEYAKLSRILTVKPQVFVGSVWSSLKKGFQIDFAPAGSSSLLLKSLRLNDEYSKFIPDFLLDCGANVNLTDSDGNNALHISVISNTQKRIVERILKNIKDIDIVNKNGDTALDLAFANNKESLITLLLDHGAHYTKLSEEKVLIAPVSNEYSALGFEL